MRSYALIAEGSAAAFHDVPFVLVTRTGEVLSVWPNIARPHGCW